MTLICIYFCFYTKFSLKKARNAVLRGFYKKEQTNKNFPVFPILLLPLYIKKYIMNARTL